jgi:hypothetical protein
MKWLAIAAVIGSTLAGCAVHSGPANEGYAFYGDEAQRLKEQQRAESRERAQQQSARDFATPRGLWW